MQIVENAALYEALKSIAVIPEKTLTDAFTQSEEQKTDFGQVLLDRDVISDENLGITIADILNVPYVSLSTTPIDTEALHLIPEIVAKKQLIIAFEMTESGVKLAMNNPKNEDIATFIEKKTGEPVKRYYATEKSIQEALNLYKKDLQQSFQELISQELSNAADAQNADISVSHIVDLLIEYAYDNKASDIHIEPEEHISLVRFRIDGVLHDVLELPKELHDRVISRIKVLSQLRTDERLHAQDGKMKHELDLETIDIRVSLVPVVGGEKVVMRLLSSHSRRYSLQDLGMSERDLEKVRAALAKPHGAILSTGPTGSGKTTTIYAILKVLNTPDVNIATIEDPVEYTIERINQIQVNTETHLTFADGLRSILRQDPDVIFVGEIRDEDTASIAINSAMTGHLVLSTLHTNDAATAIPRFIEMGVEPFLVASSVNIIIAQRLVRKICESCKMSDVLSVHDAAKYISSDQIKKIYKSKKEIRVYKGKGCPLCHQSGYKGRVGIFEVMEVSPEVRSRITERVDAAEIMKQAVKEKMTPMFADGVEKVIAGITTFEEIIRVARE